MSQFDTSVTVGQYVTGNPQSARVFEALGIDFCCGGKRPLAQACADLGLDAATLMKVLAACPSPAAPLPDQRDWSSAGLGELIDHIVSTHHVYLRSALPRLSELTAKVAQVHGPRDQRLVEVAQVHARLREELESHMMKEEQILFPIVAQMEKAGGAVASHCGSVRNPIRQMEHEHDIAGQALAAFVRLTDGYTAPAEACNTYRAMLSELQRLEADLHQHIHKENNILFPRAVKLEGACAA